MPRSPGSFSSWGLAHPPPQPAALPGEAAPGLLAHGAGLQGVRFHRGGGPPAVGGERPGRGVPGLRAGPGLVGAGAGGAGRPGAGERRRLRGPGPHPHPGHDLRPVPEPGDRPGVPGPEPGPGPAVALGLPRPGPGGPHQGTGGPGAGGAGLGHLGGGEPPAPPAPHPDPGLGAPGGSSPCRGLFTCSGATRSFSGSSSWSSTWAGF